MFGESDNNRSQDQGRRREARDLKEGGGKGTTVGRRTGSEAAMRAMSVLGNAKSNRHRKTHRVEPDGAGQKFMHLTRGGLRGESGAGVSRGRSSEDARGNPSGAKGQRDRARRDRQPAPWCGREGLRNEPGVTTTVATRGGAQGRRGWIPPKAKRAGSKSDHGRGEEHDERQ